MALMTIPMEYFDTLLRRAELHVEQKDNDCTTHLSTNVSISKAEHDALLRSLREYKCLRTALIAGGVTEETLNLLTHSLPQQPVHIEAPVETRPTWSKITQPSPKLLSRPDWSTKAPVNTHSTWSKVAQTTPKSIPRPDWSAEAPVFVPKAVHQPVMRADRSWAPTHEESRSPSLTNHSDEDEETSMPSEDNLAAGVKTDKSQNRALGRRFKQRTLVMTGLPDRFTLLDIVKTIRGGQLLNLYVPPRERLARISFVEANAAEAFYIHSKRHGIYVLGRRVELFYNERPFFMAAQVGQMVFRFGATRNLVIRNVKSNMTSQSIRDDLDHIHNLEVVQINVIRGEAYVSLNSVHIALIARSCMQSRLKYKTCRIDFYPDECDQPLPQVSQKLTRKPDAPILKSSTVGTNRFQMLASDEPDGVMDAETSD